MHTDREMLRRSVVELNLWTECGCPAPDDPEYADYEAKLAEVNGKQEAPAAPVAPSADAIPADCAGALHSRSGGLYLPWGPYLDPESVKRLRADLVGMIEELAVLEAWPDDCRDDVLARAIRGPLSDLLPNLHYFRERTDDARAEHETRKAEHSRAWRANDDLRNRGY